MILLRESGIEFSPLFAKISFPMSLLGNSIPSDSFWGIVFPVFAHGDLNSHYRCTSQSETELSSWVKIWGC
jgi:hypothetical protein